MSSSKTDTTHFDSHDIDMSNLIKLQAVFRRDGKSDMAEVAGEGRGDKERLESLSEASIDSEAHAAGASFGQSCLPPQKEQTSERRLDPLVEDDGSSLDHGGLDNYIALDEAQFVTAFSRVLGDQLTEQQLTHLFMKIDANSDGEVDWDEFTSFM